MNRGVLLAAMLCFAPTLATAEGDGQTELTARAWNNEHRAACFEISGRVPQFPDGTKLHVALQVKGDFVVPITAKFFSVILNNGSTFSATDRPVPRKLFAPLTYVARLQLHVGEQSKGIQAYLMKEFGYVSDHSETIALTDVVVGTEDESADFRLRTLFTLRDYLSELTELHTEVVEKTAKPGSEQPEWQPIQDDLTTRLKEFRTRLKNWESRYVVWHEKSVIEQIRNAHSELMRMVYNTGRGGDPYKASRRDMVRVDQYLKSVTADVTGRLPSGAVRPSDLEEPK